jgi:hypothetical protein
MKRFFIPLFAAALLACSGHRPEVVTPVVVAEVEPLPPQPTVVSHGNWTVTLPVGWTFDDVPQLHKAGPTTVLTAKSGQKVGRGNVRLSIDTVPLEGFTDELFAMAIAENAEEMFEGKSIQIEDVEVDGHSSSFTTLIKLDVGAGVLVLASARGQLGYIVACSGDALKPVGQVVGKTCVEVLKTFHAK